MIESVMTKVHESQSKELMTQSRLTFQRSLQSL